MRILIAIAALCAIAGCASGPDPLTIQNLERARTIWEQDRRADLDDAKVKARLFEFEQAIAYERSK